MPTEVPYIPGQPVSNPGPFARYLPPVPAGVASGWLDAHLPTGAWVLDPFCAAPRVAVEAARAGYRVLVAANNPVARFLLEMAANPPSENELRAALADLAATFKGDERMELHIRSLYSTECAHCGQEVEAEAFLWDRGANAPFGRIYHCLSCGDAGERPATEADVERAAHFASGGLHYARALERVAPLDDPDRPYVEEALATYLPRAVYALFTLINKLNSLPSSGLGQVSRRSLAAALLLTACEQGNNLWPYPGGRARPRQLTTPPRFRENNVWLALEAAVALWGPIPGAEALPLTYWPAQPPQSGGICLFEGRLKDLGEQGASKFVQDQPNEPIQIDAALAALPRPNQAFWSLSALWAGWIWGREAAGPFKSVLRRRRFDWSWHCTALHSAMQNLALLLAPGKPFLGLIGEAEPGFLSAALIAARMAGFELEGMALRVENGQAQITWRRGSPEALSSSETGTSLAAQIQDLGKTAVLAYLRERAEPAAYLSLHAAALAAMARSLSWPEEEIPPADVLAQTHTSFQQVFSYRGGFIRYGGSESSLEAGLWWLKDFSRVDHDPLADQVEMAVVRYLHKQPGCTLDEIEQAMCIAFPGLFTPELSLIHACLASYGEQSPPESGWWQLNPGDQPKARRADLAAIHQLLQQTGLRLGFTVKGQLPLSWQDSEGNEIYAFYVLASAVFGKIVSVKKQPGRQAILVYPGSRAGLIEYKLNADPHLRLQVEEGWRFVKFRHVRRLAENSRLNCENLDEQLGLDPLKNSDPQMPLL